MSVEALMLNSRDEMPLFFFLQQPVFLLISRDVPCPCRPNWLAFVVFGSMCPLFNRMNASTLWYVKVIIHLVSSDHQRTSQYASRDQ